LGDVATYTFGEKPTRFGLIRGVGKGEISQNSDWKRNDTIDDCSNEETLEHVEGMLLKKRTKKPSPSSKTRMAVKGVINSSL